jgi:hypothetical protein
VVRERQHHQALPRLVPVELVEFKACPARLVRVVVVNIECPHSHKPCSLSRPNPKYFLFHPSHQIFRRMHGALNVGKKDN